MNDIMYLYDVIFLDIIVLHNIISLIWVSIGCFGWTVSDGFRCSEQAEVIDFARPDKLKKGHK